MEAISKKEGNAVTNDSGKPKAGNPTENRLYLRIIFNPTSQNSKTISTRKFEKSGVVKMSHQMKKRMQIPFSTSKVQMHSISQIGSISDCFIWPRLMQGDNVSVDSSKESKFYLTFTGTEEQVGSAISLVTALIMEAATVAQTVATLPDMTPLQISPSVAPPAVAPPAVAPPAVAPPAVATGLPVTAPWGELSAIRTIEGASKVITFSITAQALLVGRYTESYLTRAMRQTLGMRQIMLDAQVLFVDYFYVSRRHFEIVREENGKVMLRNISPEGTKVNGDKLPANTEVRIRDGAIIQFPGTNIVVHFHIL